MAAGRDSPGQPLSLLSPCDRRDGEDLKRMDSRCSCPHLSEKLSTLLCCGLCTGRCSGFGRPLGHLRNNHNVNEENEAVLQWDVQGLDS